MDRALAGVKVIECCNMVAGPYCAKLLADLGAETIKVERPGVGDEARQRGPFLDEIPHPDRSGLFLYLNTNKIGITLNIGTPKGKDIFYSLLRESDILVKDLSPKESRSLALDRETLNRVNPKLIICSITNFGETGPYQDYKSYSLNTLHAGGEGYLVPGGIENIERPPAKVANFFADFCSGLIGSIATLAALYQYNVTGRGQYIDISKQESVMFYLRWGLVRYPNENLIISRATEGYWFGGILPCKDGFTVFWCVQAHEWERLKELMGSPAWTKEEKFKDFGSVILHGEEANAYILEWLVNYTGDELYHMGQKAQIPFGKIMTAEDLAKSEQLKAREFFVPVKHPTAGTIKYPAVPYKLSETPWEIAHSAPLLGEHNEEIFCQRLGFSKEKLGRLRAVGII
jgi:CoA:oxalate CoA-transferase